MAKVSKNSKVDRGKSIGESKNMVKIIKFVRTDKSGSYSTREKVVHKDLLQETVKNL
ncbi:MAG: DUF4295 family protein [Chitinophagales bacterium]|nr:DUF4295 family protein [Bacteroidota bacterium]